MNCLSMWKYFGYTGLIIYYYNDFSTFLTGLLGNVELHRQLALLDGAALGEEVHGKEAQKGAALA